MNACGGPDSGEHLGDTSRAAAEARRRMATYGAARRALNEQLAGALALSLLRAASASGLLEAALTPRTMADLAVATALPEPRVVDLCLALDAFGIFDRHGEAYALAPGLAPLADPGAPQDLHTILDYVAFTARLVADADTDRAYAGLSPDDMLVWAAGQSPAPAAPLLVAGREDLLGAWPELRALYEAGACELELGCGLAGRLLTMLVCHPRLTAVAVELQPHLLDEARQRAVSLGVADRVEFRLMDARDVSDEAAFDLVFWSQFFFPTPTRPAALAAARRALRPGGYLVTSLLTDPPSTEGALREPAGREYAWRRLLYRGAGLPVLSAAEVRAEVEAAGFVFVRSGPFGISPVLLAHRPIG